AWPSGLEPGPIVREAIAYAADTGVVVVAGAGNNQEDIICYPAAYQEVFAIGATDYRDKKAYYSSCGTGLDFMAPGGDLNHDLNNDGFPDGILQLTFKTRYMVADGDDDDYSVRLCDTTEFVYKFLQGTSLSTAEVSGIVGLMLSANPALSVKDIHMILRETALDLGKHGWDEIYGYGLVRPHKAVSNALEKYVPDADNDGYISVVAGGMDCDDSAPYIHPGAPEVPNDGIDQDCDGTDLIDADEDGFASPVSGGADCNDYDLSVYPGAPEVPNDGIDQDCDGTDLIDADEDGFASPVSGGADCNDLDPSVYPGAFEILNDGVDQNCNGWDLTDADGDGYASLESGGSDCDDTDRDINPGALEIEGDGIDQDCSGSDLDPGTVITDPAAPCSGDDYEAECDSCSNGYEIEAECN
ncbi:MAG: MopE-related protein, partial [bacterium]